MSGGFGDKLSAIRTRVMTACTVLMVALLSVLTSSSHAQQTATGSQTLRMGVLAAEGATRTIEAWSPTVDLLNSSAEAQELPYRFQMEPHTAASLVQEMSEGELDLILGDPAAFVVAQVEEGARPILSIGKVWQGRSYDLTGALIFVRADSPVSRMQQVAGRRVMGVNPDELTGWKLALQELRKYRLTYKEIEPNLLFSGGNEREVVYAVQNNLVDVGVVRAGVLERLAAEGVIDMAEFRPIGLTQHAGYPFWVSTPLYPDWILAALPSVDEPALALMIDTLLDVRSGDPASQAAKDVVWQAPQNYQSIHELLISLRARPYHNYLQQAAYRIYTAYRWPAIAVSLFILLSLGFLIYELRRNAKLAEARKDVLQSEVRSKHFYRRAIEDHTVFCMLTKDGVVSHVNEHFLKVLGRTRSSVMHNKLSEIMRDVGDETLQKAIMSAMEAGVPWQGALQLVKEDGKSAWVQSTFIPVTGTSNKLSEIAIVASDVTKTREGVSETRFNNTLELIQDQVIVIRPGKMDIMYANSAAVKMLVTERMGGEWKGKKVSDFISEEDYEALKIRCEALEAGPQRRMTWEAEGKGDMTYEISLEYAQPDQDEPRFIAIYRDVSERKLIEKAKNEFIATVSHELRTPLTSMKGALGLAKSGALGEVPDKMNPVIDMAATSCDRLVVLINDILDLEKIEAGKMDFQMIHFDLNEVVSSSVESNQFYAEKFDVTVERLDEVEGEAFDVYGDPSRLTQVMDNLLSNAAKFSEAGSKIEVSLKKLGDRIRVSIRDYGEGIPEKAQATIFDKFTQADSSDTRSKGGTGLGLSIVRLIVENHKGAVDFVSVEGVGTEFFVDLPIVENEEMVPIPRVSGKIQMPTQFTNAVDMPLANAIPETAAHRLVDLLRGEGWTPEFEIGRTTVTEIVAGDSGNASSSALNWMGPAQRTFLGDLVQSGDLTNREVCMVEVTLEADPAATLSSRNIQGFDWTKGWLNACTDLLGNAADPKLLAVVPDNEVKDAVTERGALAVDEAGQASAHPEWADMDIAVQFGAAVDAITVAIYPKEAGGLPKDWPVMLIVSRMEAAQNARGKVSKFTSGGGGRGRRRA